MKGRTIIQMINPFTKKVEEEFEEISLSSMEENVTI